MRFPNRRVREWFTLCICIMLISSISSSYIEEVEATDHSLQDVQNLLNSINTTISEYNETLFGLLQNDSVSSKALNYSQKVLGDSFHAIMIYRHNLAQYSEHQTLLNDIFDNLTEIKNEIDSLSNDVNSTKSLNQQWSNQSDAIVEFFNSTYNQTNITETDYENITTELMNNTTFMNLLIPYINTSYYYIFLHNDITSAFINITGKLNNCTINHYNEYISVYNATVNQTQKSSEGNNKTESNSSISNNTIKKENQTESSSKSSGAPLKMISHNHLENIPNGGLVALQKADDMDIDYVRMDFPWYKLYKEINGVPTYLWDADNELFDFDDNWWYDYLDYNMLCTQSYDMDTLVISKCDKPPKWLYIEYKDLFDEQWNRYKQYMPDDKKNKKPRMTEREMALFASWHEQYGTLSFDYFGPHYFLETMIEKISEQVEDERWNVVGFQVENEPNLNMWPKNFFTKIDIPTGAHREVTYEWIRYWDYYYGRFESYRVRVYHWEILFTTYSTSKYITDMLSTIKDETRSDIYLDHTKTVVNLYVMWDAWQDKPWLQLANNQNLDILGADVYYDQL